MKRIALALLLTAFTAHTAQASLTVPVCPGWLSSIASRIPYVHFACTVPEEPPSAARRIPAQAASIDTERRLPPRSAAVGAKRYTPPPREHGLMDDPRGQKAGGGAGGVDRRPPIRVLDPLDG